MLNEDYRDMLRALSDGKLFWVGENDPGLYWWEMTTKSRLDAAGALHHVMVRGIERGKVFRNDTDRNHFEHGCADFHCATGRSGSLQRAHFRRHRLGLAWINPLPKLRILNWMSQGLDSRS
jgi:hypothetical protein